MTPLWVSEALIERYFSRLDAADLVVEPSCGAGGFLFGLPLTVPAIGVEIDPLMAARARRNTGREIIAGDFRTVELQVRPTAIIGNPPFRADVFDGFLDRAFDLLPDGGRAGFILPNYMFQTAARVVRYSDRWSLQQEMLPRSAFHSRMKTPLIFAVFGKDRRRVLIGFALYGEAADAQGLQAPYRELMAMTEGSLWRAVCRLALERLGGEAALAQIYGELEQNRPTRTQFWREKIRQTLRVYRNDFVPITTGRYALAMKEAA